MRYISSSIEFIWTYVKMRLGVNLYQEETWSYNGNNFKWQKTTQWYDDILQYLMKYTIFWNSTGIKTTRSIICFTWIVNYCKLLRKRKETLWRIMCKMAKTKNDHTYHEKKRKITWNIRVISRYNTLWKSHVINDTTTWQDLVYCMN